MFKKTFLVAGVLCTIFLMGAGCTQPPQDETNTNKIKIGGAFALTGIASRWGQAEKRAAQLAIEEYNSKNKPKVELIVEDTLSKQKNTLSAVKKLINVNDTSVIIGPTWLETYRAAAPLADTKNTILFSPSAPITAVQMKEKYKNVFSTWYRSDKQFERILQFMKEKGVKDVVLLHAQEPYWQDIVKHVKRLAPKYNINIKEEFKFKFGSKDFRTQLLKIKRLNPDGIIGGTTSQSSYLSLLKQRQEIYPDSAWYTATTIETFVGDSTAKGLLNDIYITAPKSSSKKFRQKYKKRWGKNPAASASNSYDATKIILKAIKNGARTDKEIKKYLFNHSFDTYTFGKIKFEQKGDEIGGVTGGEFEIKKINDNKIEVIDS